MGDPIKGKKLFMKLCASCHAVEKDGKPKMGPNLHGIIGKTSGTTFKEKPVVWDEKSLNDYLEFPNKFVPSTKMAYYSIKKSEDRKDVIAFLTTLK